MALEVQSINGQQGWWVGTTAARVLWIAWHRRDVPAVEAAFRKAVARSGMASTHDELLELHRQGVRLVGSRQEYLVHRAKLIGETGVGHES